MSKRSLASRACSFVLVPCFALLALLACGGSTSLIDIAPSVLLEGSLTQGGASLELSFDHSVGSTGCPQLIDEWTVSNDRDAPITVIVSSGDSAILIEPTTAQIAPGDSASFRVSFTCSRPTAVDETVNIEVQDSTGATLSNRSVRVRGNVR